MAEAETPAVTLEPWQPGVHPAPFDATPHTGIGSVAGDEVFVVLREGEPIGLAGMRPIPPRTLQLGLMISPEHRRRGSGREALPALVELAVARPEVRRIEMRIDDEDRTAVRVASRAGLRKEGVLRGAGSTGDAVLMARLIGDPTPGTGDMFRAGLNAGLPTKRAIAQGLVRNSAGDVLLCELTYKRFWDLPGGVVDPGESPAHAIVREIEEELQLGARVRSLPVVSWLPPWQGWDDAMLYLFEVAIDPPDLSRAVLEEREIRAVHWADRAQVEQMVAPYTARLIEQAIEVLDGDGLTRYLEDGVPPRW